MGLRIGQMRGEYLMCCRSYSRDHDSTTSSYCIISCSGKKSPEIESQVTVLWAKHDSSEHFLNSGEPDENANLPGASGCGSRRATIHHFTLCRSPPCRTPHPLPGPLLCDDFREGKSFWRLQGQFSADVSVLPCVQSFSFQNTCHF